jgi:murein DD-endopeptidase MepM/ murein hydrolase activator NlpD
MFSNKSEQCAKNFYIFCILSIVLWISTLCLTIFICKRNLKPETKYVEVEKIVKKEVIVEKTIDEYFNDYYKSPMNEPVWVSSPVGPRSLEITSETFHRGDDFVGISKNTEIKAAADGIVVEHWPAPNGYYKGHPIYGGYIVIQHDNGTYTVYAHMSDTIVHTGEKVKQGQKIGVIGDTGLATGVHLHFEIVLTPHNFIKITT